MEIKYTYPEQLLPAYHHALYQLIVGVEQGHSKSNLEAYAKNLRELAKEAFLEYDEDKADALRFRALANAERTVAGGKWSIQVIKDNKWYNAYFEKPPKGNSDSVIIYPNRLEALRACCDQIEEDKWK